MPPDLFQSLARISPFDHGPPYVVTHPAVETIVRVTDQHSTV